MTPELIEFVKGWEGLKLKASRDPLNNRVTDIGYGHVIRLGEIYTEITAEEAEVLLVDDLLDVEAEVLQLVGPLNLSTPELDALVSFAYNEGATKLSQSTLLRKLRFGDKDGALEEFPRWMYAGGKPAPGLLKRRIAEQAMFRDADYSGRP